VVELSQNLKIVIREKEMAEAAARQARDSETARTIAPSERDHWQGEVGSVLQCDAGQCVAGQRVAVCCRVLQCIEECCRVLQCGAVWCIALHCVVVCCIVL